jgi:hypothetical protein
MSLLIVSKKKNPVVFILSFLAIVLIFTSIFFFYLINSKEIEKIKAFKPTTSIPYELEKIKKFIPEKHIFNLKTNKNNIILETTNRKIELSPLMARYKKNIKVEFMENDKYIITIPINKFTK